MLNCFMTQQSKKEREKPRAGERGEWEKRGREEARKDGRKEENIGFHCSPRINGTKLLHSVGSFGNVILKKNCKFSVTNIVRYQVTVDKNNTLLIEKK